MRIATWNLDRGARDRHARSLQAEVIAHVAADVWVLTEAQPGVLPAGWKREPSAEIPSGPGSRDAGCFAVVGAAALERVDVPELPTAACALVPVADETWMVLGICMPWRRGAPPLPANAAPGAEDGPGQWRAVLGRLDAVLGRLAPRVGPERLLLAGDLNQTLSGRNVGFAGGRQELERLLARHGLAAYTADAPSRIADCASVDHVCGPQRPHRLAPWPGRAEPLSDHRGYVVDVG